MEGKGGARLGPTARAAAYEAPDGGIGTEAALDAPSPEPTPPFSPDAGMPVSAAPSDIRCTVSEVIAAKGLGPGRPDAALSPDPAAEPSILAEAGGNASGAGEASGAGAGAGEASGVATPAATPPTAILMIMAAVFGFSILDATVKSLVTGTGVLVAWAGLEGDGLAPVFVVWARFAGHVLVVGLFMGALRGRPILQVRAWGWQVVRALCMASATLFNFLALQYLQLAQTVAIFFVAPMVVTALAGPMLGEWVGWRRWLAILAGFGGVLLMARPGTDLFQPALVLSILSMLGYSLYVLMTRWLAASETADSLLFVSALVPGVLLTLALPVTGGWDLPATGGGWLLVLTLGLYGVGGHFLFVRAYRLASTGALAPFTYVQIPFMVGLGWLVFGDLPDRWTVIGIGVIVLAGLYIVVRERQLAKAGKAAT